MKTFWLVFFCLVSGAGCAVAAESATFSLETENIVLDVPKQDVLFDGQWQYLMGKTEKIPLEKGLAVLARASVRPCEGGTFDVKNVAGKPERLTWPKGALVELTLVSADPGFFAMGTHQKSSFRVLIPVEAFGTPDDGKVAAYAAFFEVGNSDPKQAIGYRFHPYIESMSDPLAIGRHPIDQQQDVVFVTIMNDGTFAGLGAIKLPVRVEDGKLVIEGSTELLNGLNSGKFAQAVVKGADPLNPLHRDGFGFARVGRDVKVQGIDRAPYINSISVGILVTGLTEVKTVAPTKEPPR